jgi:protein-serine/threonine kinase
VLQGGEATPRAQVLNPFDAHSAHSGGATTPGLSRSTASLSIDSNARRPQSPGGQYQLASGLRTPTSHGGFHPLPLPLGTPGAGQPTTGLTVGGSVGQSAGIGFGLHEPPKMRKAMSKLSNEGTPPPGSAGSGVLQPHADDDGAGAGAGTATPPQGQGAGAGANSGSARGTLNVKLISARGLAVSGSGSGEDAPEPYVVMQFEQNEFISRAPHAVGSHSAVPFTTAQAQPMVPAAAPGNLTRSASGLGVGTISRAFAEAMGRGKGRRDGEGQGSGAQTPKAEDGPGGGGGAGGWLGRPGPGDPVWKEEVVL